MMSWRTTSNNNDQDSILRQRSSQDADDDEPDSTSTNYILPGDDETNTSSKNPHFPRHHERLEDVVTTSNENATSGSKTITDIAGNSSKKTDVDETNSAQKTPQHLDDDGTDHAIEAAPDTVTWKPQNMQTTCEFTHYIKDYASKRESGCKKAEYSETTTDEHGNKWRLIIYVNGNGRASNHHLSLFLQVADAEALPFGWKKAVSYVLTLEHPENAALSYAKRNPDKTFKLCPKAIDWGWSQFITSDRIQQEGFVSNDSLTVRASVTVKSSSVSIDEEDAELYLKCAVEDGDAAAVKLCLDQGASVNCQFKDDLYTPLHTACSSNATNKKGSMKVLLLLLQQGADGNACNKWRETPLLIAANNGHLDAVDALLAHKADPSLCSEAGWSALTFAAHKGYDDIVALLLKADAPVNTRVTEDNSTPLHKACAGSKPGHLAAVKLLLDNDADVHALNKWRETPLLTAANHGQSGAVDALLKAGADPCKCTDTGWSPLSIAAYKGHDDVVRLLLNANAPTEEDDPTLSALLQAATKGLPDTVELLLEHGADHNVTTKKGDTALSILVEQNLIDAAVEMVTIYNASIPRCSRDGKKRQRARLLINLRIKQMEKDGRKFSERSDDDETDEEENPSLTPQHDADGDKAVIITKNKKKNSRGESKQAAEEKARVAEEALLKELELEELQAKKDEKEANSKRDKKRKKREKERLQKLKEEKERREQEEIQARERERVRKEKEEQQRREQAIKLKEQREREMKEAIERERVQLAKREERERRERELAKQKKSDASTSPSTSPDLSDRRSKSPKAMKNGIALNKSIKKPVTELKRATSLISKDIAPVGRRWETNPVQPTSNFKEQLTPALPQSIAADNASVATSASPPAPPASSSSKINISDKNTIATAGNIATEPPKLPVDHVEHPAVALFRREKVAEMLHRCKSLASVVGEHIVKRVMYRWIIRAAHDSSPYVDPLVPSWKDFDSLVGNFQRQFISETRRTGSSANMEALKDAGAAVASLCVRLAEDVQRLQQQVSRNLSVGWSDADIGMTAEEYVQDRETFVSLTWAKRSSVKVSSNVLHALRIRHVGRKTRFLTAAYVTKIWYETLGFIADGTSLDIGLTTTSQKVLCAEAFISAQLWSEPLSIVDGSSFWGKLIDVDRIFGGHEPFGKQGSESEHILALRGGALSVVPPLDSMIASQYVKVMFDLMTSSSSTNVPLSFLVILPAECFPSNHCGPSLSDLNLLDPRLGEPAGQLFVQHVECLRAGQHFYRLTGTGAHYVSPTNSLLVLLQNPAGKVRFGCSRAVLSRTISSFSTMTPPLPRIDNRMVSPIGFSGDFSGHARESPHPPSNSYFEGISAVSPEPLRAGFNGFVGGRSMGSTSFPPASELTARAPRRGRLFDLVDDVDEDQTNDVDLVSGMLNSLDMGLFQSNGIGSDVDIEAISLMGINGNKSSSTHSGSHGGVFPSQFN